MLPALFNGVDGDPSVYDEGKIRNIVLYLYSFLPRCQ